VKMLWSALVAASCLKLLYLPSYKSTDFEVHRNWLAITSSLPVSRWYTDTTSPWTLDYPPFFAWFELLLSKVAVLFDPGMLELTNLNYSSENTILFQRLSVIVTDLVFGLGAWRVANSLSNLKLTSLAGVQREVVVFLLLLSNFGLFIVDHIHFQYNGFLFGVLLLSISALMQSQFLLGGLWFAVLLNLKHIYLYVAPAYFIFLLRSYCFQSRSKKLSLRDFSVTRLLSLGLLVLATFAISFGPFLHQIEQVAERLFPFRRGLCHAYWAPNFWALYNTADKVLTIAASKGGLLTDGTATASMTGGLVQDIQHTVLPNIPPVVTFLATFLSMIPALVKLWLSPNSVTDFLRCLTVCGWSSFLFGWHVHEKAVLIVVLPLTILAVISRREARIFLLTSITGHFSLFPLLYTTQETGSKAVLFLFFTAISLSLVRQIYKVDVLRRMDKLYLLLVLPVFLYAEYGHAWLGLMQRLPFIPLLLYSVYCAVGILYSFLSFYAATLWS